MGPERRAQSSRRLTGDARLGSPGSSAVRASPSFVERRPPRGSPWHPLRQVASRPRRATGANQPAGARKQFEAEPEDRWGIGINPGVGGVKDHPWPAAGASPRRTSRACGRQGPMATPVRAAAARPRAHLEGDSRPQLRNRPTPSETTHHRPPSTTIETTKNSHP